MLEPAVAQAIAEGRLGDPFAWLGMHETPQGLRVVAFDPGAETASVRDARGRRVATLARVHEAGVFAGHLPRRRKRFDYRLVFAAGQSEWEGRDPYAFGPVLGDLDAHLLAEGRHYELHDKLGAHPMTHEGVDGTAFAVWAPNARRVSVVGDFNFWDGRRHPMRLRHRPGVWEIFLPGIEAGASYKYEIVGAHGALLPLKADPVGQRHEHPPATGSVVAAARSGPATRGGGPPSARQAPMSIYEVHLGSWRRGAENRWLTYDELADTLVPYARAMGFTHLQFMPVTEHPFTGSWGYQPIGMFAPTARFGEPEGFARLVEACHAAGLGVFVDWVPAHFPSDEHGLASFDGTHLYEHADPRLGFHLDWNTLIYNFGRREVANFLACSALFWLERYGVDGLRVDAVASMLYLDYSRPADQWLPNIHGGRENLEAIAFLRDVNRLVAERCPDRVTIAEESTAWPGVSRPTEEGGLGFNYKWNMGWMHDTLQYMALDPVHRRHHHHLMTFGIDYAFTEDFVLPLSHDEVVHGKGSLIGKMPGDRWQQFANLRAYYGFMWSHPGKKLLFMGGEFAQWREWNHDGSLDWHLTEHDHHAGIQTLLRDLNGIYRNEPALHERDCEAGGFAWIEGGDVDQSVLSFERIGAGGERAIVVCNFTPVVRHDYAVGATVPGRWRERLNTDARAYGGSGIGNGEAIETVAVARHGRPSSLTLTLPPLATIILTPETG
ncbi:MULTISPECIES: 1,4-alpha-glucan branching protein GlgB [unclassified Roseitalea]|uniref:1,4-alpha-glucan branching protein GlgB n=1 Tax=unclassified Roseitalea TaxID=2639107 RepID=UPI00273DA13F|nr:MULTISPECIES: 1,4-alpha-glucan branching protein GlgB [unclassified Roseitalea]